jgi:hypothetical protein
MKTTLDLPSELVREIKLRAVYQDKNVKDVAAELLRLGLLAASQSPASAPPAPPQVEIQANGLPLIRPAVAAAYVPASRLTTTQLLALETEALTREDRERLGLPL